MRKINWSTPLICWGLDISPISHPFGPIADEWAAGRCQHGRGGNAIEWPSMAIALLQRFLAVHPRCLHHVDLHIRRNVIAVARLTKIAVAGLFEKCHLHMEKIEIWIFLNFLWFFFAWLKKPAINAWRSLGNSSIGSLMELIWQKCLFCYLNQWLFSQPYIVAVPSLSPAAIWLGWPNSANCTSKNAAGTIHRIDLQKKMNGLARGWRENFFLQFAIFFSNCEHTKNINFLINK